MSSSSARNNNMPATQITAMPKGSVKLVVAFCCWVAMGLQIMNVRGSFSQSLTAATLDGGGALSKDCREFYESLKDSPTGYIQPALAVSNTTAPTEEPQVTNSSADAQFVPPAHPPLHEQHNSISLSHRVDRSTKRFDFPLPHKFTREALVVIVLSRRNAFDVRQAIRDTWASGHDNVYFVVGQACEVPPKWRAKDEGGNPICQVAPRVLDHNFFNLTLNHIAKEQTITDKLLEEQSRHQDLLMMHEVDIYRTLPAKLKYAYTFVDHHLPEAEWVLKVDDDFYVRIEKIANHLNEIKQDRNKTVETSAFSLSSLFGVGGGGEVPKEGVMVSGDLRTEHQAFTSGKWKEVPQWAPGAVYPAFPLGSCGHIVNRPIFHYVAEYQQALFDYQGEDVSIGIWLTHPSAPKVDFVEVDVMPNHGDCRNSSQFVVGHDVKPKRMFLCFKKDRPDLAAELDNKIPKNSKQGVTKFSDFINANKEEKRNRIRERFPGFGKAV